GVTPVTQVARHPEGDLALLGLGTPLPGVPPIEFVQAQRSKVGRFRVRLPSWARRGRGSSRAGPLLGEDIFVCGFAEVSFGPSENPVPRLLRGYFQRTMDHVSHMGYPYRYRAAEVSVPFQDGISGGPVFQRGDGSTTLLHGIVCESVMVATETDAIETHTR